MSMTTFCESLELFELPLPFFSTWHRENQVDLLLMAVSKLRPNDRRYIPWPSQGIPEPLAATGLGTENCNQHLISRGHITSCLHTSCIGDYKSMEPRYNKALQLRGI